MKRQTHYLIFNKHLTGIIELFIYIFLFNHGLPGGQKIVTCAYKDVFRLADLHIKTSQDFRIDMICESCNLS